MNGAVARPRVCILVRHYLPGFRSGGPVRSLANLVAALAARFDFHVLCLDRDLGDTRAYAQAGTRSIGGATVHYLAPEESRGAALARRIRACAPALVYVNSLLDARFGVAPLLLHRFGRLGRCALLVAPRGELAPGALALKARKKALFLALFRALRLGRSAHWHATTAEEADEIVQRLAVPRERISVAPNLSNAVAEASDAPAQAGAAAPLRIVFLSRISPKKNLLQALRIVAQVRVAVHFDIYGPIEDARYWDECRAAIATCPGNVVVQHRGELEHARVVATLAAYDLFFLPTQGENFGHAIAEALAAGLPLLVSDRTPWRGLAARGVGDDLPLDDDARFVAAIERHAALDSAQRGAMRVAARACAAAARAGAPEATAAMFERALATVAATTSQTVGENAVRE